ncbi:MAG: sugar ABC transporter permease [Actinomycetota bacterium]|nr:sugar ABC transporter permease [Actinomycetota bacterium]
MSPDPVLENGTSTALEDVEPTETPSVILLRLAVALVVPVLSFGALWVTFEFLRDTDANRLIVVTVALVVGVIGVWLLYWGMNLVVSQLPDRIATGVRPAVFVGPAVVILSIYLVYPAVNTIVISFMDDKSESFVWFENYVDLFTEGRYLIAIRNSVIWVLVVPFMAVAVGLGFAVLVDKLGRRTEAAAKSMIFLPMAISMVGASIVWRFIYSFRPPGFGEQIGLLNGIWTALGNNPVAWLLQEPWNNLYLMVILIWLQTGFAMVILSSAIKSVPADLLEAGRIDGATEWQVFWRIVFPSISSTVVVVTTTIVITVWKVFDIVWVMTGGKFGTSVIAEKMITEFFLFRNAGTGAALAVLLFVAVIPIMIINVRKFREQEATR